MMAALKKLKPGSATGCSHPEHLQQRELLGALAAAGCLRQHGLRRRSTPLPLGGVVRAGARPALPRVGSDAATERLPTPGKPAQEN